MKRNIRGAGIGRVVMMMVLVAALLISCKRPPTASFVFRVENGGVVYFTNTSAGVIDRMQWSFGDDSDLSDETNPVHRYVKPGSYSVTLSVENADGSSSLTQTVDIEAGDQGSIEDHPRFEDGDGYFYARNIYVYGDDALPTIPTEIRAIGVCAMYDSSNFLVNVGKVTVNNTELTNNPDNTYSFYSPDSSWYFDAGVVWTAEGGNGFPTVVKNVEKEFPVITGIVSNPDYDLGTDTTYIIRVAQPIILADSIIWRIETEDGTLMAQKSIVAPPNGVSGVLFELNDLSKITAKGTYRTKVIAYSFVRDVVNFRSVYFTKESYTEGEMVVK